MDKEKIVEKQCVGCGKTFTTFDTFSWIKMYCNDTCKSNHSLFHVAEEGESK